MAGPIQSAISGAVNVVGGALVGAKKLSDHEKQVAEKESAQAKVEEEASGAMQEEAKETAIEADLIRMGADPKSARAFMDARKLGLDTTNFGLLRRKGKIVGSYSSVAEKLAKDALTDTLSSRVINDKGFSERIMALGGTRRGRVDALVGASKGGKK